MSTVKNTNDPIGVTSPWRIFLNHSVELSSMLLWFAPFIIFVKYEAYTSLYIPIIGLVTSMVMFHRLNKMEPIPHNSITMKTPVIEVDWLGNKLKEGDLVQVKVTVGERPLTYTEYVTFKNGILGVKCRGEWLPLSAYDYHGKDYGKYGRHLRYVELSVPK